MEYQARTHVEVHQTHEIAIQPLGQISIENRNALTVRSIGPPLHSLQWKRATEAQADAAPSMRRSQATVRHHLESITGSQENGPSRHRREAKSSSDRIAEA